MRRAIKMEKTYYDINNGRKIFPVVKVGESVSVCLSVSGKQQRLLTQRVINLSFSNQGGKLMSNHAAKKLTAEDFALLMLKGKISLMLLAN